MKTRSIIFTLFILLNYFQINAQNNIDMLVAKAENMESVDISIVRKRNPESKQIEREVINITIKSDPALVNQFIEAFKKDEPNATTVVEEKKDGKIIPQLYKFDDSTYSFSFMSTGQATISIIKRK